MAMAQAGDTPWHWASNMKNEAMCDFLVKNGASKKMGNVIVPEHIPKVKVRPDLDVRFDPH
jgi:ankyrin repeat protein